MKSVKQYNLGAYSVGITDSSDLLSTPLTMHHMRTKFHENWFEHSGNIKVITSTFLRGCSVGVMNGKNLRYVPLR
jgi:hypothetical protein